MVDSRFSKLWKKKLAGQGARQVKLISLFGYLGVFCLIPMFSNNKLARSHAKQGLAILLVELIFFIGVLSIAFFAEFGSVWHFILVWVTILFWLWTTALRVIGLSYAARDMDKEVPVAGWLAKKLLRF